MTVIDHGFWVSYKPEEPALGVPKSALFFQRQGDQVDWYVYCHATNGNSNFGSGHVVGAAYIQADSTYIVGPVGYDPTAVVPHNAMVFEVTDYTGTDPVKDFRNKIYNPADGSFTDPPPPPPPQATRIEKQIMSALDAIVARLEKLEKK
jgi:hypothetical protein